MYNPTANEVASIQINVPSFRDTSPRDTKLIERYIHWFRSSRPQITDNKPEALIYKLKLIEPIWLNELLESIRKSVIPTNTADENDGRWLNQDVADAANDFFRDTADLLPGEPVIYSSHRGDLVSEFSTPNGPLTIIISPTFVMLFTSIDGVPVESTVTLAGQVRGEVEKITGLLRTGQYGAVETQ